MALRTIARPQKTLACQAQSHTAVVLLVHPLARDLLGTKYKLVNES